MDPFPPYTFVPGGPWPHPRSDPRGHSYQRALDTGPAALAHGIALFNAGFYWEAHEVWEGLWHAHQRNGPTAELLKGLIKLAAAGVKVRQHQPHGVVTHARRAAEAFRALRAVCDRLPPGTDLERLIGQAEAIAADPPSTALDASAPAAPVLGIRLDGGPAGAYG